MGKPYHSILLCRGLNLLVFPVQDEKKFHYMKYSTKRDDISYFITTFAMLEQFCMLGVRGTKVNDFLT